MAFSPIAFTAPNYRDYKTEWLKAYEPGTTTPKSMATDSTLNTLIAKAQLNADGFIVSAGQALIIPYIDGAYDLWLFPTEPEADANDTSSALRLADNMNSLNLTLINNLSQAYAFDTVALMQSSLIVFPVNKELSTKGYTSIGDGGHASYIVKSGASPNIGSPTLTAGLYAELNDGGLSNVLQWGALGDGVTDDSDACQAVVDSGSKDVFFPNTGLPYICWDLDVGEGVRLHSNGATYKLPVIPNGFRGITTFPTGYTGAVDSLPLIIEGFVFDGNRVNQGPYLNFEKEQSALIFISAAVDSGSMTQPGLLNVIIRNCQFKESTADGISIHRGVKLELSDCSYYNCFRGSFTITGGGSRVTATNQIAGGDVHPSAHQIEVDSSGFGGGRDSWVNVSNSTFAGGFDVATQLSVGESDADAEWYYSNCTFGSEDAQPFNVNANSMAKLRAVNCKFGIGTDASRIFRPGDSQFTSCDFMFNSAADVTALIQPGTDDGISTFSGQRLKFLGCKVNYDDSFLPDVAFVISAAANSGNKLTLDTSTDHGLSADDFVFIDRVSPVQYSGNFLVTAVLSTTQFQVITPKSYGAASVSSSTGAKRKSTYGFSLSADDAPLDNVTTIDSCDFPSLANYSFYLSQGGKVVSKNNNINSAAGYFFSTSGARSFDVTIDGNNLLDDVRLYSNIGASVNTGNRCKHQNTIVEEIKSAMWTVSNYSFAGPAGQRIIQGTTPSLALNDSSAGLAGDEWRIFPPVAASPYSYVCRTNNYTTQNAAWLILNSL